MNKKGNVREFMCEPFDVNSRSFSLHEFGARMTTSHPAPVRSDVLAFFDVEFGQKLRNFFN